MLNWICAKLALHSEYPCPTNRHQLEPVLSDPSLDSDMSSLRHSKDSFVLPAKTMYVRSLTGRAKPCMSSSALLRCSSLSIGSASSSGRASPHVQTSSMDISRPGVTSRSVREPARRRRLQLG